MKGDEIRVHHDNITCHNIYEGVDLSKVGLNDMPFHLTEAR
jgi:hypothetical protein